jgi:hypothetical protein
MKSRLLPDGDVHDCIPQIGYVNGRIHCKIRDVCATHGVKIVYPIRGHSTGMPYIFYPVDNPPYLCLY